MELLPQLGFEEASRGKGHKVVPWLCWDHWIFARDSLFSSSPDTITAALSTISGWRSRGCLPIPIQLTASIVEIQQKDPFFRSSPIDTESLSEEMLAMLYCMAIMRLVNGVIEKTRKKEEISIGEAADAIGIPRILIDIRHEGSHRDLPSLRLVRHASIKALEWLKSYYWEPQSKAIPVQADSTSSIRKEIEARLFELAFFLKSRQTQRASSLPVTGKRVKHCERLCGRTMFFSLMAGKLQPSKSVGTKKQITKTLKVLERLYSSSSSEVVSILLDFLLKASDYSSESVENLDSVLDDWKRVITKFSIKETKLLLNLMKAVLEMIESQHAMKYENAKTALLSSLFVWLVGILKGLKPLHRKVSTAETDDSSADIHLKTSSSLTELLHKSLVLSSPDNKKLMGGAQILASMTRNLSLVDQLIKLSSLHSSLPNENFTHIITNQEDLIRKAAEKLEFVKFQRTRRKKLIAKVDDDDVASKNRWVVEKTWNPCPIGMLPGWFGSSGVLPVLDGSELPEREMMKGFSGKREAECDIEVLGNSNVKKMRERETSEEREGVEGRLLIGGVWRRVGEEEMHAIGSAVRMLV